MVSWVTWILCSPSWSIRASMAQDHACASSICLVTSQIGLYFSSARRFSWPDNVSGKSAVSILSVTPSPPERLQQGVDVVLVQPGLPEQVDDGVL